MFVKTLNNFGLREVIDTDHEWLVELHNDPLVLRNITNPSPITIDGHLSWWNSLNPDKEKRFIFTVDDKRVGFTKFYKIDLLNQSCALGADIHQKYRGQGFARHMWTLMLQYSFENLRLWRVSLTTAEYNNIGQKVYKNIGFVKEGRHKQSLYRAGKFHDEILMYMTREMYEKS